jgi:hypothetical protein
MGWHVSRKYQVFPILVAAIGCLTFLASLVPVVMPVFFAPLWFAAVVSGFWGWGTLLRRLTGICLGFALQTVWGAACALTIAGPLLALGVLNRYALSGLIGAGVVLSTVQLVRNRAGHARAVSVFVRGLRGRPVARASVFLLVALFGFLLAGAMADRHTHPYDDDIAYLAFVRRLWDTGDLLEPFSTFASASVRPRVLFDLPCRVAV